MRTLPTDSTARKGFPIFSGCIAYFGAALAGVARWSKLGNDKHNPGEPLHHARGKSMDHRDCIPRHLMDLADLEASIARSPPPSGLIDPGTMYAILDEVDALAWRSLALSQELHEKYAGAPLAPGARLPEVADHSNDQCSVHQVVHVHASPELKASLDKIAASMREHIAKARAAARKPLRDRVKLAARNRRKRAKKIR